MLNTGLCTWVQFPWKPKEGARSLRTGGIGCYMPIEDWNLVICKSSMWSNCWAFGPLSLWFWMKVVTKIRVADLMSNVGWQGDKRLEEIGRFHCSMWPEGNWDQGANQLSKNHLYQAKMNSACRLSSPLGHSSSLDLQRTPADFNSASAITWANPLK